MNHPAATIVVVENDSAVSEAVARLLRAAGFCIEQFPSAESFLSNPHADLAACLIVDIHLDGMSGFDLQARLIETGPNVPLIFISGDGTAATRQRAERTSCLAFLYKPLDAAELIPAVQRALARRPPSSNNEES